MDVIRKNEVYTVSITGYSSEGLGVARVDGQVLFVHGGIAGEECDVLVMKVLKNTAFGKVVAVRRASPHRAEPACPYFGKCGGCAFWHMDYEEELSAKRQKVWDALERLGGQTPPELPILPSPSVLHYRNKVQYPVAPPHQIGFYRARSHQIIEVEHCLIQSQAAERVAAAVRNWMAEHQVNAYDEQTGKGWLRHLYVRTAQNGAALVCLVATGKNVPAEDALIGAVRTAWPDTAGIVLNVNARPGNSILGPDYRVLWGAAELEDTLCGHVFALSVPSFYQVNRDQAEQLYALAVEFANLKGGETALELYCGAGTITLALAEVAGRVIGAEIVPEAIENAKANAVHNGISNVEFFCGDAGEMAQKCAAEGLRPDVVVVDPPRKGLAPEVIDAVAAMDPARVVYISCDPATLGRDVKRFAASGYRLHRAAAVDMFPRTHHVETVVLLSKGEVDSKKIRVEFSLEDMDMSEFQDGATYPQIKAYVLEHSGLKVSNLYISQIKRKCGIEVGKNYNLPKSEDSRQPQCPPEKEKAIREAFKYFGMI